MGHTPGPWDCHFATAVSEQADEEWVDATGITNVPEEEFLKDGGRGDLIAFVPHDGPHAANARLIAAAPELLAALRIADEALDYAQAQVDSERDRKRLMNWRTQVQNAISLAEGKG